MNCFGLEEVKPLSLTPKKNHVSFPSPSTGWPIFDEKDDYIPLSLIHDK
jgi:hypothetical protein